MIFGKGRKPSQGGKEAAQIKMRMFITCGMVSGVNRLVWLWHRILLADVEDNLQKVGYAQILENLEWKI